LLAEVKHQVAEQRVEQESPPGPTARAARLAEIQSKLTAADIGDKVFPHFIVRKLPPGVSGLLIAAILAAAMSSIDTSLNSSATVLLCDIYRRYWRPDAGERESMRVLYLGTLLVGVAGTGIALAMIGVESVLEAWWTLSGIFAGGLLGLFLLGMISRRAGRPAAMIGVLTGLLVIAWMTFSDRLPPEYEHLRNPLHAHMTIVVGTLAIFGVGLLASRLIGSTSEPRLFGQRR
jgi:SSS family solute:Na+ symporter